MDKTLKWLLGVVLLFVGMGGRAQGYDPTSTSVSWGVNLVSELQLNHIGDVNFANLLKTDFEIPFCRNVSLCLGAISTYMTREAGIGNDLQTFSNLDAEPTPMAFAVFGLNFSIHDKHTLFFGVRNMNEDYFASPVTSFFTNSSCGVHPTISANYAVANYPEASLGLHYRYETAALSFQASLYNGKGYHRIVRGDNIFRFNPKSDGIFALAELQYQHQGSQFFLGGALHCHQNVRFTPWIYLEQSLAEHLRLIVGYSHAFGKNNWCKDFAGIGIHWSHNKWSCGAFTDLARYDSDTIEWATEVCGQYVLSQHILLQPIAHFILIKSQFLHVVCLRIMLTV